MYQSYMIAVLSKLTLKRIMLNNFFVPWGLIVVSTWWKDMGFQS